MKKNSKYAKKYAKSLFNSVDLDSFEDAFGQLTLISELMQKNREINASLVSPLFSLEDKAKSVDVLSETLEFSDQIKSYLKYIVTEGMAGILPEILKIALTIYQEKRKKARASVITPVEFPTNLEGRLKDSLESLTSKVVDIEYVHDPSLLGGFIVKIGSTMYDSSLKGQLRLLKDELIKR